MIWPFWRTNLRRQAMLDVQRTETRLALAFGHPMTDLRAAMDRVMAQPQPEQKVMPNHREPRTNTATPPASPSAPGVVAPVMPTSGPAGIMFSVEAYESLKTDAELGRLVREWLLDGYSIRRGQGKFYVWHYHGQAYSTRDSDLLTVLRDAIAARGGKG